MCDSVKKRTIREKHMYTYCVLKGIMIMNNKYNIYILGLKNKYVRQKATQIMNFGFLKNNLVINHTL